MFTATRNRLTSAVTVFVSAVSMAVNAHAAPGDVTATVESPCKYPSGLASDGTHLYLADWREDERNKVTLGQDVLARRPTLLRAFAIEAGGEERLSALRGVRRRDAEVAGSVKALYSELAVFAKAENTRGNRGSGSRKNGSARA